MVMLADTEKTTVVMAYTQTALIRGELVTREGVRVSTWFRTESSPDYLRLNNVQWIEVTGGPVKPQSFTELFLPVPAIVGFHIAPPARDPWDYDEREGNRVNAPLSIQLGRFFVRGKLRVSTKTDVATALTLSHTTWLSIYEAEIHSVYLPQMPVLQVPMLILRPTQVAFVLKE